VGSGALLQNNKQNIEMRQKREEYAGLGGGNAWRVKLKRLATERGHTGA